MRGLVLLPCCFLGHPAPRYTAGLLDPHTQDSWGLPRAPQDLPNDGAEFFKARTVRTASTPCVFWVCSPAGLHPGLEVKDSPARCSWSRTTPGSLGLIQRLQSHAPRCSLSGCPAAVASGAASTAAPPTWGASKHRALRILRHHLQAPPALYFGGVQTHIRQDAPKAPEVLLGRAHCPARMGNHSTRTLGCIL